MAVDNILLKQFSGFKGLDLESSDLVRPSEFASDLDNVDINLTNAVKKRKGFQWKSEGSGGFGLSTYNDVNLTTGAVTQSAVSVDANLHKLTEDYLSITYSGSNTALLFVELLSDGSAFNIRILDNSTEVLDLEMGLGVEESVPVTIATVKAAIDALADFSCSGGTTTSGTAAFLDLHYGTELTSTATRMTYKTWSQANASSASPFTTMMTNKNATDFEGMTFANMNNILYMANGYTALHKYDGQNVYKAGLPAGGDADGSGDVGTAPTTAETGTGSTFSAGQTYYYKYLYRQIDNKGNIVEGITSPVSIQEAVSGTTDLNVTVTNLLAASGFNTNCAQVNGAQVSVTTITVDTAHTLIAGDTAYFYDSVSASFVTRTVTAVTATTVAISGAAVTVADNAAISNNLRIVLYRTANGGTATGLYAIVKEVPNNSLTATQVILDQVADASLGAEYVLPIKPHGLPPMGRYLTTYRNQLFIAGNPTSINSVYYSDIDSPEYFPSGDNSFLVDAFVGSKITGLGALDTAVFVFKDLSIQAVTGDISEDSFRVDEVSYGGIGCSANKTIQSIAGSLFFLSQNGVYSVNTQGVQPVGRIIGSEFTKFDADWNFKKAVAINWTTNQKYLLFMPSETLDGSSNYYANSDSRVYVYDYKRSAWFKWSAINAQGGLTLVDSTLYFQARRYDTVAAATQFQLGSFKNYGNLLDFSDHHQAISFTYKTNWESLGDPAIFKKFLRLKVFSLPSDVLDGEPSPYTLSVDVEFDFVSPASVGTFTMDFSGGSEGYGDSGWGGSSPWGDSSLAELRGKLKVIRSRSMRLTFSNSTVLEDAIISGYELEIAVPFRPFMKD